MIWLLVLILAISLVLFGLYMLYAYLSEKKQRINSEPPHSKAAKLCNKCATGKKSYELDPNSEACPHITSYKNGKCEYFKSMK